MTKFPLHPPEQYGRIGVFGIEGSMFLSGFFLFFFMKKKSHINFLNNMEFSRYYAKID